MSQPATSPRIAAAVLLALSAASAEAGGTMSAAEIDETLRGITLDGVYHDGAFFSETYFEDGSLRYRDAAGVESGDWSIDGDLFCTFYERLRGACFFVVRQGDNCFTFFEAVRGSGGDRVPRPTWTSRGWNRRSAATCVKPPEAAI